MLCDLSCLSRHSNSTSQTTSCAGCPSPPSLPLPAQPTSDGRWELHPDHQARWQTLEQSLLYIITKLRKTYHSLFSLDYRPYRNPSDHGYLRLIHSSLFSP